MDLDQRPELRLGSVDFVVGKEYWVQDNPSTPGSAPREPQPLHYIFAIDVSFASARCGLVKEVVAGLRELLYPAPDKADGADDDPDAASRSGLPVGSKVAIMTFDRTVQFFNLKVRVVLAS
jgi:protein transport protein SEC24